MGSIIVRTRKDDTKAYTAQIVIKQGGKIVHREAETFDRKQAANAWIVKREGELKRPGGLERKEDPTLSAVIERYIAESKNAVLGTKAQVLRTIKRLSFGCRQFNRSHHQNSKFSREVVCPLCSNNGQIAVRRDCPLMAKSGHRAPV